MRRVERTADPDDSLTTCLGGIAERNPAVVFFGARPNRGVRRAVMKLQLPPSRGSQPGLSNVPGVILKRRYGTIWMPVRPRTG